MKKKYAIGVSFFAVIICISFSPMDIMKSGGGPVFNTNAPGEKTCSGGETGNTCHSGGIADNSGSATKSITFSGGTTYVPGQTYTVTVTVSHPTRNRFGFQIVSLVNSNDANTGTVTLTDLNRTTSQIPGAGSFPTRNYVMHTLNGSNGIANSASWSYNWTAPSVNEGAITFYACMMAANNNNTNDSGDETYFTQLTINPSSAGILPEGKEDGKMVVFPNPATSTISINYTLNESSSFKAELIDLQGKLVQMLVKEERAVGVIDEKVTLARGIAPGVYLIKFTTGSNELTKRIIIKD